MKRIIATLLIIIIFSFLSFFWFINKEKFLRPFDANYFAKLYSESQYILGPKSIVGIGDDGLYAFAGYYYLFQAGDPSNVYFEHPPLGKYLIGLSIFLFRNENAINIIYFLILLVVTYKLGRLFINEKLIALLPVCLLVIDSLFLDHTIRSQLDLPFSLFFVLAVFFFLKSFVNPIYLYLSQIFWAAAFSTRFFPFLLVLEIFMLLQVFLNSRQYLKHFIFSTLFVPVIYLLTHASFFIYHPSIMEFFRHKKWMLSWFIGTPVKPASILMNIFGGVLLDAESILVVNIQWSPLWPLIVIFSFIFPRRQVLTIYSFMILYFFYVVFLTGGQAKFLMPIFPLMAVLSIKNLARLYSIIPTWMELKSKPSRAKSSVES